MSGRQKLEKMWWESHAVHPTLNVSSLTLRGGSIAVKAVSHGPLESLILLSICDNLPCFLVLLTFNLITLQKQT